MIRSSFVEYRLNRHLSEGIEFHWIVFRFVINLNRLNWTADVTRFDDFSSFVISILFLDSIISTIAIAILAGLSLNSPEEILEMVLIFLSIGLFSLVLRRFAGFEPAPDWSSMDQSPSRGRILQAEGDSQGRVAFQGLCQVGAGPRPPFCCRRAAHRCRWNADWSPSRPTASRRIGRQPLASSPSSSSSSSSFSFSTSSPSFVLFDSTGAGRNSTPTTDRSSSIDVVVVVLAAVVVVVVVVVAAAAAGVNVVMATNPPTPFLQWKNKNETFNRVPRTLTVIVFSRFFG